MKAKATTETWPISGENVRLMVAVLIPLAALVLQWVFWVAIEPYVWFLFYPAVFFSSWVGGRRGGLVATVLSVVLVWYCFIPPQFTFAVQRPMAIVSIAVFAVMGIFFSVMHGRLRRANQQAAAALAAVESAKAALESQVCKRTADLQTSNAALRESEQEFRTLAEAMPQIVWITRADGWNIYFNRQWMNYTGMTLEESHGHGWNVPFHPEDKQRAWDAWQSATTTGGAYELECRLRRADGAYRWWLVRGVPLRDAEGNTLKWFGTCTDIDDIKRAQEALRESRATLDVALGSMTDAICISDVEGRFFEFNQAFATFHKFRSKADCAKTLSEYSGFLEMFLPNGDVATLEQWPVQRALHGETVGNAEYTLRRKDTGATWVGSYSFAPIYDKDGTIVGAVITGRDITERRRVERELEESTSLVRVAGRMARFGGWSANLADGRVKWSEEVAAIHETAPGFSPSLTEGIDFYAPEYRGRIAAVFAACARDGTSYDEELVIITARGKRRWVRAIGEAVQNPAGAIVAVQGAFQDITDRKQVEEVLHKSEARRTLALDAAQAGTWEWELTTNQNIWSDELWKLYGLEPYSREPSYETWQEIVHPEDRERVEQNLREAVGQEAELNLEWRVQDSAGGIRWLMSRGRPLRDASGRATRYLGVVMDITERKRAEEELQRTHSMLVEAQKIAHLGSFEFIASTATTIWSEEEYRIYGLDPTQPSPAYEEMLAKCIHPDDKGLLHETFTKAMKGHAVYELEHRIVRPDGSVRWVYDLAHPYLDGRGELVRYVGATLDITERKQSEAALRESEERFRTLVEQAPEGIFIQTQHRFAYVNGAMARLMGATGPEQLLGAMVESRIHPLCQELVRERIRRLNEERLPQAPADQVFVRLDGSPCDVSVSGVPFEFKGEKGALVFVRDITERKRAEAAARESEERFRTMANSMAQLAWIAKADGFIFWYNQRWYEYTGTTPEQMEGWGWQSVHDPAVLPIVMENWQGAIAAGKPFEMEFPLRRADGQYRTFLTRGLPLKDSAGQVLQWFGTNTDVEELKQVEEKIQRLNAELEDRVVQRTVELEAVNRELESFAYSVSHDLRAPLRGIDGWSQAIVEDYGERLDSRGREYLAQVCAEAQRMGQLIDDLLELSRVTRTEMNREPVDLSALAETILSSLAQHDRQRSVETRVTPNLVVRGDPVLLRLALENLLGNAWKFTSKRECATIEFGALASGEQNFAAAAPTTADPTGGRVFFVRDNGAGFDMAHAKKLFAPFQRLHRQSEFPGTGIGLATVQRILHRHGGRVWAEAASDRGATFYFRLPIEPI